MRRIHDRWPRAHVDGHAQRLHDLVARRALRDRRLDVEGDAVVAADGDADAERDQLLGFGVERPALERRLRHGGEAFHDIRRARAQLLQGAPSDAICAVQSVNMRAPAANLTESIKLLD